MDAHGGIIRGDLSKKTITLVFTGDEFADGGPLVHIGTDPRRKDRFYEKLDPLLTELKAKQYTFIPINNLLE